MSSFINKFSQLNIIEDLALNSSRFDFNRLYDTPFAPYLYKMEQTMQDSEYHGEGNVLNHTKLVLENLVNLEEYKNSSNENKVVLFLAGLTHDFGKITRTKIENGRIVSPNHTYASAYMVREVLWKDFNLAGSLEAKNLRESVAYLVRYHGYPPYAIRPQNTERKTLKILANGELFPWFFAKNLYALEKADGLGRIGNDDSDFLSRVEYFKMLTEDLGVYEKPFNFSNSFTKRAYFLEKTNWKEDSLYKNTWGEVILVSGIAGTGKDYYISKNYSSLPTVSLDDIRKELKISPLDTQGKVITLAKERCKEFLRKKQPFVFNATNITTDIRSKQISLFEDYGASVKTIFLETNWQENLKRNKERGEDKFVPENVLEKMLSKLEPPERYECETVEYKQI